MYVLVFLYVCGDTDYYIYVYCLRDMNEKSKQHPSPGTHFLNFLPHLFPHIIRTSLVHICLKSKLRRKIVFQISRLTLVILKVHTQKMTKKKYMKKRGKLVRVTHAVNLQSRSKVMRCYDFFHQGILSESGKLPRDNILRRVW